MKTRILAFIAALAIMSGCPSCGPTPTGPCEGFDCIHGQCVVDDAAAKKIHCLCDEGFEGESVCDQQNLCWAIDPGHGTCNHSTGVITCQLNWYPNAAKKCMYEFKPEDPLFSLAHGKVCPGVTGNETVIVADKTNPDYRHNGDSAGWKDDTVTNPDCAWFFLKAGSIQNLPNPNGGTALPFVNGVELWVVDTVKPVLENGKTNFVRFSGNVRICLMAQPDADPELRATPMFYDPAAKTLAPVSSFEIVPGEGVCFNTDRQGGFYLANFAPAVSVCEAVQESGKKVIVTVVFTDEGSGSDWNETISLELEDGTPLTYEKVVSGQYRIELTGGNHTVTAKVTDSYGETGTKASLPFSVNLCASVNCPEGQLCTITDGICRDDNNPCTPNPCQHGGLCTAVGVGTFSCACQNGGGGWTGPTCDTCPAGYTGPDCHLDLCYQVTCSSHGVCNPMSGECDCNNGYDKLQNCGACADGFIGYPGCVADLCHNVSCPDDNNKCNGSEACNADTGACVHVNPLVCDDGFTCNGAETCDPTLGCRSGAAITCSGHGDCRESSGSCACRNHWTGSDCSVCPANWAGSDCDICAVGYEGTNCTPDVTPPPAPVLTLCEGSPAQTMQCPTMVGWEWDPGQANIKINGTTRASDTVRMQVMDCLTENCAGTWADFAYVANSGTWSWSTTVDPFVVRWFYFRAIDAAGNPSITNRVVVDWIP